MDLGGLNPKIIARKAMTLIGAAAALAACAATAVVALAFTIYAILKDLVGAPGASAIVVGVVCIIAGIVAYIAYRQVIPATKAPSRYDPPAPPPQSTADRIFQTVRDRPIIAAGAAFAAGLVALRNPVLIAAIVRALTEKPNRRP
jgi:protein-S-isoprenylcysteine O-methyltransferase Ste14